VRGSGIYVSIYVMNKTAIIYDFNRMFDVYNAVFGYLEKQSEQENNVSSWKMVFYVSK